jgi:hypothetical protein
MAPERSVDYENARRLLAMAVQVEVEPRARQRVRQAIAGYCRERARQSGLATAGSDVFVEVLRDLGVVAPEPPKEAA